MKLYKIEWKKSAYKELRSIQKDYIPKIINAVDNLSKNPYPKRIKKLSGSFKTFRLRVGVIELFMK